MRRISSILLVMMMVVVVGGPFFERIAYASHGDSSIRVMQRKPFLRKNRAELAPRFGVTFNDAMYGHYLVGGNLNYHLTEWLSFGVTGFKAFGEENDLYMKVQSDYSLVPRVSKIDYLASGQVNFALIYGKFALFNTWVIHFDTSATLGAGTVGHMGNLGFTGNYGLGQRFFLSKWLTFDLGFNHYMFMDQSLTHAMMVTGGLGIFLPFGFRYSSE